MITLRGSPVLGIGRGVVLALALACGNQTAPLSPGEGPEPPPGPIERPPAPAPPAGPIEPPAGPAPPPELPPPSPQAAEIYIADADGSRVRVLTTGERPAWSPDGQRIAFQRDGNIHVVGALGGPETYLGSGREPAWSPDGASLAFTDGDGIAVMLADGTDGARLLTHGFRYDINALSDLGIGKPAWSPDGSHIAFEHLGDGDLIPAQIFVMGADGSSPRRLTPTQGMQYAESDPAWSPDGTEIVFWSYGHGIAAVAAGGGFPRTIYQNAPAVAYGASPAWSPDGRIILFTANQFLPGGPSVWAVGPQGGAAEVLVEVGAHPVWSPDGISIAFGRVRE